MKLKLIAVLLTAILLLGAAGCGGGEGFITFGTPEPESTTEATEAPAGTEAVPEATSIPTQEPDEGICFLNNSGAVLKTVYISPAESDDWGDPLLFDINDGERGTLTLDEIGGAGVYDFGAVDETGLNYDAYDVELNMEDCSLELVVRGSECKLNVIAPDGSDTVYDVNVYMPGEQPEGDHVGVYVEQYFDSIDSDLSGCIMDIDYALPMIADYSVDDHPRLTSTMDDIREELIGRINDELDMVKEKLDEPEGDVSDWEWRPDAYSFKPYVRRADNVLSLLYCVEYSVHSEYVFEFASDVIDTATGERLSLADIVTDVGLIVKYLNEECEKNDASAVLDEGAVYSRYFNLPNCPDFAWTLDSEGLSFRFNEYDGPFGDMRGNYYCPTLLFKDYPDLVKPEYIPANEEFVMELPMGNEEKLNLGGVGCTFAISKTPGFDDEDNARLTCVVGDSIWHFESRAFEDRPAYFHTEKGDFIYLAGWDEYWQKCIFVFELTPKEVKYVDYVWLGFNEWYADEEDSLWGSALMLELCTDPESFALAETCDMIGTADAVRYYAIDDGGTPITQDEYGYFSNRWLTVKKAFFATEVNYAGTSEGETHLMTPGTKALCLRTDFETICDIYVDGMILRLTLDNDPDHWKYYGEDYILDLFEDVDFYD